MTIDTALAGYWPGPWPAEDGGPRRLATVRGAGLGLATGGRLVATSRQVPGANMLVWRDPDQLYLQGAVPGASSSWVERVDPDTLRPLAASGDLPGGPWWAGGIGAHADGHLYVVHGRWCHRLDPDCALAGSLELPRERPYNSFVALADGSLVMKDFSLGLEPTELVVVDPGSLSIIARTPLPEASIARLSADGDRVVVVGITSRFVLRWEPSRPALVLDEERTRPYVTRPGQTFGWDPVLAAGSSWFLDDGAGTEGYRGSFRGVGPSTAPLQLVRITLDGRTLDAAEVCGEPGGIIANPPIVDEHRSIAVGYDSGNGVLAGFRFGPPGTPLEPLWQRPQDQAGHLLLFADTGELATFHYDHDAGADHCVVLDVATGDELGRAPTGSPVQTVLFPAPGRDRDLYTVSFTTVARVAARG
ncbi:MAG: hypothetical protein IPM45_03680 [Acidimicrobiales bacterium]|nr:hypothetical protein [Acidimicrobiales bacterium]